MQQFWMAQHLATISVTTPNQNLLCEKGAALAETLAKVEVPKCWLKRICLDLLEAGRLSFSPFLQDATVKISVGGDLDEQFRTRLPAAQALFWQQLFFV